jgi:serine/threonine protein kinase
MHPIDCSYYRHIYASPILLTIFTCGYIHILVESESDVDLLARIFNVLGTPTDETWPNVRLLPNYIEFDYREALNLSQLFRSESGALDLLLRMLTLNPSKRISAAEVCIMHDNYVCTYSM